MQSALISSALISDSPRPIIILSCHAPPPYTHTHRGAPRHDVMLHQLLIYVLPFSHLETHHPPLPSPPLNLSLQAWSACVSVL